MVLQIQNTMVLQETAHFLDEIGLFLSCSFSTNRKEEIEPEKVMIYHTSLRVA